MSLNLRRAAFLPLALLVLSLTACENGVRIGSLQLVKPRGPLEASGFELTRRHAPAPKAAPDVDQKLGVDLDNSRGSFTDTDGKVYPVELTPEQVTDLRAAIANRQWMVGTRLSDSIGSDAAVYNMKVISGGKTIKDTAIWAVHPHRPAPVPVRPFVDVFDRAERIAHPLSDRVDLVK